MNKKRILIFNVNWLGDVLFSTPVIRNIRRNFSDCYLACVIPPRCYPILKDNPYLDEVIIFDENDRHKSSLDKLSFIQHLRRKKFDMVFLLHRSFSRALITRLAGIKERVGHRTKKRAFLLTKSIPPPDRDSLHRIDYYLDVIEKAGLRIEDRYLDFFIRDEDTEFVDNFLKSNSVKADDVLIGLNPGGNWLPKRWPAIYWARLIDEMNSKFKCKIIITGSSSDVALIKEILSHTHHKPIVASAVLNIKQLGALCKKINLFITADTGPLHIANAVGVKKIIALFGPTSPLITGPFPMKNVILLQKDVGCKIPCYTVDCKDNRCMKAVEPGDIIKVLESLEIPKKNGFKN